MEEAGGDFMWLVVLIVVLLMLFYFYENYTIELTRHVLITKKKLQEEVKILHLTDLHGNKWFYKKIIKIINTEKPDVIVITGDLINTSNGEFGEELFEQINDIPIYYVSGNHEHKISEEERQILFDKLKQYGIKNLDELKTDEFNEEIVFIGIDGISSKIKKIPDYVKRNNEKSLQILLMHQPETIDYLLGYNINIAFAGHAHGGQWRIPILKQGIFAPDQGLFPKYTSGKYVQDNVVMFVSRGIGTMTFVPRIFNRPHILIINLKR